MSIVIPLVLIGAAITCAIIGGLSTLAIINLASSGVKIKQKPRIHFIWNYGPFLFIVAAIVTACMV